MRVAKDASVGLTVSAPGEVFTAISVDVNDVRAYTYDGAPVFAYPDAFGTARNAGSLQSLSIKMRRHFDTGARVSVVVSATTNLSTSTTATFTFSVEEPPSSVRDASARRTRVDGPFPARVLELYRQAALGAIGTRGGSALALLVHRVKSSQLGCLLPELPAAVLAAADAFRPDELAPIARLAEAADQLDFMRPYAEEELQGLGVAPEVIATLSRVATSSYPQERAAAFALTVILAANKLG